ncbi:MAG: hypothetical protein LBU32_01980 [Clostridiales bacterium]|jgi:hypothetical protein|nr:hypothetical protein [Clostridiales bacterium]
MAAIDKDYCMSSFLTLRAVLKEGVQFSRRHPVNRFIPPKRFSIKSGLDAQRVIKAVVGAAAAGGKAALSLSGGIDNG